MPIYAYRCEACGHAKDVLQKVSDPVLTTCPACGAVSRRVQSRYRRRVVDLPLGGRRVELLIMVRRFRCDAVLCY